MFIIQHSLMKLLDKNKPESLNENKNSYLYSMNCIYFKSFLYNTI